MFPSTHSIFSHLNFQSLFSQLKLPNKKMEKYPIKILIPFYHTGFFLEIPNKIALLVALVLHHSARKICTIQFPKSSYCPSIITSNFTLLRNCEFFYFFLYDYLILITYIIIIETININIIYDYNHGYQYLDLDLRILRS